MKQVVAKVRPWVIWWFCLGIVGAAIALPEIFLRDLTHFQERILLSFGIAHWLLGGIICWAWEGVKFGQAHPEEPHHARSAASELPEINVLAELRSHQNTRTSPRHSRPRRELTAYLQHWEHGRQH